MENKTTKSVLTAIFFVLIFTAFFLSIFFEFPANWNVKPAYLAYGCVCATFVLALIFLRFNIKKIFITLALACVVVADYFLTLATKTEQNILIGVSVFCGAQAFFMFYTLALNKGVGLKVINLAVRVALCLLAYYIIPRYYTLDTVQMISVMYIINFAVTLIFTLFYIKTEWLMFIGLLLFILCDIVVGLKNGGVLLFEITGPFVEWLYKYDWAYYVYIPGLYLIATHSVWTKKKQNG